MNKRRIQIISIFAGFACAICVYLYLESVAASAEQMHSQILSEYGGEQIEVCVASREIQQGEFIDSDNVEQRVWIADFLPQGFISDMSEISGKPTSTSIAKGEVLVTNRFQEPRDCISVPEGTTAVSVTCARSHAVAGLLNKGSTVDLYSSGNSATTPIAQRILVLATSLDEGTSSFGDKVWVTLAVPDENVNEVIAASTDADLYFAIPAVSASKRPTDSSEGDQK